MSEMNGETGDIERIDCGQLHDVAAELALGVLTGRERATALAHLDECPACREYVRELTTTGEELLGLLPEREPPPGFESRVLARLGLPMTDQGTQSREGQNREAQSPGARVLPMRRQGTRDAADRRATPRMSARARAAAAVVAAVVAGGLGGWGLRSATTSAPPAASATAPLKSAALLTADHVNAGEVFLYKGSPQWMYASVDMDNAKTTMVRCQLETADGKVWTVGSFKLTDGYGAWGGSWTVSGVPVTGARLVTPDGAVLASATFRD
jgi:anti-sigma-K factor RskA